MFNQLYYIKEQSISQEVGSNADFLKSREFCKRWIDGQESFTINTSGSTGTPKPIVITRAQMEVSAKMTIEALGLDEGDNALVCLNTEYIAGKMMLVRGMVCELNLYITEPSSNPLEDLPEDLRIDFMAVVPLQMEAMIDQGYIDLLNKMKAIIVGGAPISLSLGEKMKELTCPVFATYGMTETVSHIALKRMNGADASDYFQVLNNVAIAQDDRGCLTINAILTNNETIVTNDVVKIIDQKRFEWLGRADNVVNSGGLKIYPEQLENQVRQILIGLDINCNLIIAGIADDSLGEKVVLILEVKELDSGNLDSIKLSLKNSLPEYQAPKEIYCLENFVYTENGKFKRSDTKIKASHP